MNVFTRIKNWLWRGADENVSVNSLQKITDHPDINIDDSEYQRIDRSLQYYEGKFPNKSYKDIYGQSHQRQYVSLNMIKVVTKRMASIIFNEQCKISIDSQKHGAAKEFVDSILADNDFIKNFERYLEPALALGGLAMRPYMDGNSGKIKINWAQATNIFPLRSNTNDISNCAFSFYTKKVEHGSNIYYTLLEIHRWNESEYTITNELYRSEQKSKVGQRVPITMLYPDMSDQPAVLTGFSRPLFTYLKPAGFNNHNITSPLGIGICENALETVKQLNDTYDQYNWEIQLGQRRIAVSEGMVDLNIDERGEKSPSQRFDSNQNLFITLAGDQDSETVKDLTTPIRATDYNLAMNQFLKTFEMQIGLSPGTFSFDSQGLKTATEVVSENSMTYQTRNSELTMVQRSLKELVISICELGKASLYNGSSLYSGDIPTMKDITIDFDDGIFTDKSAQADYWIKLASAGLASKVQAIERIYGVGNDEAQAIADEIDAETLNSTVDNPYNQQQAMFGEGDG